MEIQDLVKLAYQASQGSGHLVASEADALAFLHAESDQAKADPHEADVIVCEPAGPTSAVSTCARFPRQAFAGKPLPGFSF